MQPEKKKGGGSLIEFVREALQLIPNVKLKRHFPGLPRGESHKWRVPSRLLAMSRQPQRPEAERCELLYNSHDMLSVPCPRLQLGYFMFNVSPLVFQHLLFFPQT